MFNARMTSIAMETFVPSRSAEVRDVVRTVIGIFLSGFITPLLCYCSRLKAMGKTCH